MLQCIDFNGTKEQLEDFLKEQYKIGNEQLIRIETISDVLLSNASEKRDDLVDTDDEYECFFNPEKDFELYSQTLKRHVCVQKIIVDLMVWAALTLPFSAEFPIASFFAFLYNCKRYFIKLDPKYYCIYLKLYYYGFTNNVFEADELFNRYNDFCSYRTNLWDCPVREVMMNEGESSVVECSCNISRKFFDEALAKMENDRIIICVDGNKYRLNR